jgi:hypothetical protein
MCHPQKSRRAAKKAFERQRLPQNAAAQKAASSLQTQIEDKV